MRVLSLRWVLFFGALASACEAGAHEPVHQGKHPEKTHAAPVPHLSVLASGLPAAPVGVVDLKFNEFFVSPVGPRGFEYTSKLKELDGRRVRILGYMVRQTEPWTNAFLLAPLPVQLHEGEYAQSDDLPATALYVRLPDKQERPVPLTPGPMLLTGTLRVGPVSIESERRSWVQMDLEAATSNAKDRVQSFRQEPSTVSAGPAL